MKFYVPIVGVAQMKKILICFSYETVSSFLLGIKKLVTPICKLPGRSVGLDHLALLGNLTESLLPVFCPEKTYPILEMRRFWFSGQNVRRLFPLSGN